MNIDQPLGILITVFLVVLSTVLIWDEVRAERRFQAWNRKNPPRQD